MLTVMSYLLRNDGQNDDLALINHIGVRQTVAVALKNGLILGHAAVLRQSNLTQSVPGLDGVELFPLGADGGGDQGILAQLLG